MLGGALVEQMPELWRNIRSDGRAQLALINTLGWDSFFSRCNAVDARSHSVPGSSIMASDGDDPDASSPSTIRDLLVELPDGEYMYKHAEAPTRDLEYEELARVVEAARSLNFYDRVRRWDDLRRIMKRKDVSSVRVDERAMNDLDALRASCAKLQRRIDRFGKAQLDALPKGEVLVQALRRYVAPDASRLA